MRDRLQNAVAAAARHGSRLAVLFVDLDQFKNINDTMGHVVGDQVLQLMARRLEAAVAEPAEAGRQDVSLKSTIAHALRIPLASIRIAAAMLEAFHADEAMLAPLPALMTRKVGEMAKFIDELLDASPARAEDPQRPHGGGELTDIIAIALEIVEPRLLLRGQRLTSCLAPAPLCVQGESVGLTQALVNLLHSASTSTPARGDIVILVKESTHKLTITLSDHDKKSLPIWRRGSSICTPRPPAPWSAVAEDSKQVLPRVRAIVESHDGSVAIARAGRGRGSKFAMTLRRAGTVSDFGAGRSLDTSPHAVA